MVSSVFDAITLLMDGWTEVPKCSMFKFITEKWRYNFYFRTKLWRVGYQPRHI